MHRNRLPFFLQAGTFLLTFFYCLCFNVTKGLSDKATVKAYTVLQTQPGPGAVLARINAGGPAVTTNGVAWSASQYFSGGKTYTNPKVTDIAGTDQDAIYLTEYSAGSNLGSFAFAMPVPTSGVYTVKLHFAEIYWGATGGRAGGAGQRVFSVNLEGGATELVNYDILAEVGSMTATVKTFAVSVSDGTLNIDFSASANQPKISAIEVLAPATNNNPPVLATALPDQQARVGSAFSFTFGATAFTDPNGDELSYTATLENNAALPGWLTFSGTTRTFSGTPPTGSPASLTVKVTASDGQGGSVSDSFVLAITPDQGIIRLNAGGAAFLASGSRQFAADAYVTGGSTTTVGNVPIDNTTDDGLYQSERYGNFSYNVPVSNGNYNVVLHFAETYSKVINGTISRKFNVDIEGQPKLTDYDIMAKAGGAWKAVQENFTVAVSDGTLTIAFRPGSSQNPKVCAIEIVPTTAPGSQSRTQLAAEANPETAEKAGLYVRVLGNPIHQNGLEVEVQGAAGQPLQLKLIDIKGQIVAEHEVQTAGLREQHRLSVAGQVAGMLFLRVSTPDQTRTLKVLKLE